MQAFVKMGGLLIAEVVAMIVTMIFGDFDPASVIRNADVPGYFYMIGAVLNWQAKKARR